MSLILLETHLYQFILIRYIRMTILGEMQLKSVSGNQLRIESMMSLTLDLIPWHSLHNEPTLLDIFKKRGGKKNEQLYWVTG